MILLVPRVSGDVFPLLQLLGRYCIQLFVVKSPAKRWWEPTREIPLVEFFCLIGFAVSVAEELNSARYLLRKLA